MGQRAYYDWYFSRTTNVIPYLKIRTDSKGKDDRPARRFLDQSIPLTIEFEIGRFPGHFASVITM